MSKPFGWTVAALLAGVFAVAGCDNEAASPDDTSRQAEASQASRDTPHNQAVQNAQQAAARESDAPAGSTQTGTGATAGTAPRDRSAAEPGAALETNNLRTPEAQGTASPPTTRPGTPR